MPKNVRFLKFCDHKGSVSIRFASVSKLRYSNSYRRLERGYGAFYIRRRNHNGLTKFIGNSEKLHFSDSRVMVRRKHTDAYRNFRSPKDVRYRYIPQFSTRKRNSFPLGGQIPDIRGIGKIKFRASRVHLYSCNGRLGVLQKTNGRVYESNAFVDYPSQPVYYRHIFGKTAVERQSVKGSSRGIAKTFLAMRLDALKKRYVKNFSQNFPFDGTVRSIFYNKNQNNYISVSESPEIKSRYSINRQNFFENNLRPPARPHVGSDFALYSHFSDQQGILQKHKSTYNPPPYKKSNSNGGGDAVVMAAAGVHLKADDNRYNRRVNESFQKVRNSYNSSLNKNKSSSVHISNVHEFVDAFTAGLVHSLSSPPTGSTMSAAYAMPSYPGWHS